MVEGRLVNGQAIERIRRVGYWMYTSAPFQFIKQGLLVERADTVNVLFTTERTIWILGVCYRLSRECKSVALPVGFDADSSYLQLDSSQFLNHHQRRNISPVGPERTSAREGKRGVHHNISSIADAHRRRANTSGVVANKKKLQTIQQLQSLPSTSVPEDILQTSPTKPMFGSLVSIPSQDVLGGKRSPTTTSSPTWIPPPFPDDMLDIPSNTEHDLDVDAETETINSAKRQSMGHADRPKSSKMNRLRSWVTRTTHPMMRRKSDTTETESMASALGISSRDVANGTSSMSGSYARSRPTSPQQQPSRASMSTVDSRQRHGGASVATKVSSRGTSPVRSSDPKSLGLGSGHSRFSHLRRKSKEGSRADMRKISNSNSTNSSVQASSKRRSLMDVDYTQIPPVPAVPEAYAGSHARIGTTSISSKRPQSSSSNHNHPHGPPRRIVSGNNMMFAPMRREANVRALIGEFSSWESSAASLMMFQREWKLPSFQQVVSITTAAAWARDNKWAVTLQSESFFMAYMSMRLPRHKVTNNANSSNTAASVNGSIASGTAQGRPLSGDRSAGDPIVLRLRVAMHETESAAVSGEAWRDAMTAIIVTVDARPMPRIPVNSNNNGGGGSSSIHGRRNFTPGSISSDDARSDIITGEDSVWRMKFLETRMGQITDAFANHFWPRTGEEHAPGFNTFPRRRVESTANPPISVDKKPFRRAKGWGMIPQLLSFKTDESLQMQAQQVQTQQPPSPTMSTQTKRRQLYPAGLSIRTNVGSGVHRETSATSQDMSPIGSASDAASLRSLPGSPSLSPSQSPPRSPPLSPAGSLRSISPVLRPSAPLTPVQKRGTLGLLGAPSNAAPATSTTTTNDGDALADNLASALHIQARPPSNAPSRHSSDVSSLQSGKALRKRKAGEAGVVGMTKGGFEVVWSATDAQSTSYVMVPVPKNQSGSESPTKMHKQQRQSSRHGQQLDGEVVVHNHSQPNLKRTLESITREINMDSSYVLLLPPPPPIALDFEDNEDEDGFGDVSAVLMLRKAKSQIFLPRPLHEFER
ncbi:hypothetical protein FBU59_001790, partial [Linderina macrospora]